MCVCSVKCLSIFTHTRAAFYRLSVEHHAQTHNISAPTVFTEAAQDYARRDCSCVERERDGAKTKSDASSVFGENTRIGANNRGSTATRNSRSHVADGCGVKCEARTAAFARGAIEGEGK